MIAYSLGCRVPADDWVHLNRIGVFNAPVLSRYVGPFPPDDLMCNATGVSYQSDFASHGADFRVALPQASPKARSEYSSALDFGCAVGAMRA